MRRERPKTEARREKGERPPLTWSMPWSPEELASLAERDPKAALAIIRGKAVDRVEQEAKCSAGRHTSSGQVNKEEKDAGIKASATSAENSAATEVAKNSDSSSSQGGSVLSVGSVVKSFSSASKSPERTSEDAGIKASATRPGERPAFHLRPSGYGGQAESGPYRKPAEAEKSTGLKTGHYKDTERSASEGGRYTNLRSR